MTCVYIWTGRIVFSASRIRIGFYVHNAISGRIFRAGNKNVAPSKTKTTKSSRREIKRKQCSNSYRDYFENE